MADKKVSDDFAKALEHLTGVPKDKVKEAKEIVQQEAKAGNYEICKWVFG